MTTKLDVLEAEVLKLAPADRSRLLERLLSSLEADLEAEDAWEAIAAARDAEIESGAVQPVPAEEAIARLRARLA